VKLASLESANRWLNDPRILPFHHETQMDLTPFWADCVVYEFPTGTVGFHLQPNGDWHAHLCLIPGAGGAKEYARQALAAMFARDDCGRVIGRCLTSNGRTTRFGHGMGFEYQGQDGEYEVFVMTKEQFRQGGRDNELGSISRGRHATVGREAAARRRSKRISC
jgi:hypothetical protein